MVEKKDNYIPLQKTGEEVAISDKDQAEMLAKIFDKLPSDCILVKFGNVRDGKRKKSLCVREVHVKSTNESSFHIKFSLSKLKRYCWAKKASTGNAIV